MTVAVVGAVLGTLICVLFFLYKHFFQKGKFCSHSISGNFKDMTGNLNLKRPGRAAWFLLFDLISINCLLCILLYAFVRSMKLKY